MRSPFKRYGQRLAGGGPILNLASAAGAPPLASAADVYTDDTHRSRHSLAGIAEYDRIAPFAPIPPEALTPPEMVGLFFEASPASRRRIDPAGLERMFASLDPDDATAPEGHAAAAALAADRSASRMVRDAGELVEVAEASMVRALQLLACVGADDAMRPLIDRVFVEATRVKNELVGVVEKFHQVGVRS